MAEILITGPRLRLRRATESDLDFIMDLEYAEDNLPFIVPFDRDFHTNIVTKGEASMDVIVEEVATGEPVGYFLVAGLATELLKGKTIEEALKFANACGAICTTAIGAGTALKDYDQVLKSLL